MEFKDGVLVRRATASPLPIKAAGRLRANLDAAVEGNYYTHAWYARMARWDVEALLEYVEEQHERER